MASKLDEIVRGFLAGLPVIGKKFQNDEEYDDDDTVIEDGDLDESEEDESEDGDLDESDEDDEEAAKKKKKTLIIRGVVILALAFFGYDLMMNEESAPGPSGETKVSTNLTPEEMVLQKRIKAKREKRKKAKAAKLAADKKTKDEADKKRAQEEAEAAKKRAEQKIETERLAREEADRKAAIELEEIEKQAKLLIQKKSEANDLAKLMDKTNNTDGINDSNTPSNSMDPSDVVTKMEKELDKQDSSAQKVSKYYAPPNYEDVGRGLVYNCKGKFWACVDRKAYFSCRKNERYQTQSKKKLECHIFNVYGSTEDCKVMQAYNVNMNTPTNFCD